MTDGKSNCLAGKEVKAEDWVKRDRVERDTGELVSRVSYAASTLSIPTNGLTEIVPVRRMESVAEHLSSVPGPDDLANLSVKSPMLFPTACGRLSSCNARWVALSAPSSSRATCLRSGIRS
jgi:hypothetical protein